MAAQHPDLSPEIAALTAGGALAALDLALLARAGAPAALWAAAAALALTGAGLLALSARVALWVSGQLGRGRWTRSLAGGLLALPVILPLAFRLFAGTGISTTWYAPYAPYVVAPLLLLLLILGLRLAGAAAGWLGQPGRLAARIAVAVVVLAGAGSLLWADVRLYPNQYLYLHWALLLLAALALMSASWLLLLAGRGGAGRGGVAWIAPALLLAAFPATMLAGRDAVTTARQRQLLAERTHTAGRLAGALRQLADRDGDHHSVLFGGQDCDNDDPRVYPFAPEVPQNGVDEDCDGRDGARPAAARPAADQHLRDPRAFRQALKAWRRAPPLGPRLQQTRRHNVVLIVLDALRADQLPPSRACQQELPHLTGLLARSRHFTRAFSTGAGTDIGMATVFTGQLDPFAQTEQTLLAAFSRAGYRTHGVFQREVEKWVGRQFSLRGLDGRDVVVNDPHRRDLGTRATSRQVTDRGIRFLRRWRGSAVATDPKTDDKRFFLWLHYFDIHEHHQIKPATLKGEPGAMPAGGAVTRGLPFYRRMIRHVDYHLGRLLAALKDAGLDEQTVVVVLGDHGEGLAQRPRLPFNHGDVLFNPLVHVPLAFRVPGVKGQQVDQPVSLADLCPTLLDLAGIQRSPTYGLSLVPWIFDIQLQRLGQLERPIFMYEARQRAVIVWPWKLITWLDQGLVELYHMEHDYLEENNRVDDLPEQARQMAAVLNSRKLITIDRLVKRRRKGPR
jgi:arylsulfatase A-like enzyme